MVQNIFVMLRITGGMDMQGTKSGTLPSRAYASMRHIRSAVHTYIHTEHVTQKLELGPLAIALALPSLGYIHGGRGSLHEHFLFRESRSLIRIVRVPSKYKRYRFV